MQWERLAISLSKWEITREHFMQNLTQKGQEWDGPNRRRRYKEMERIREEIWKKKGLNDMVNHDGVITHLKRGVWRQIDLTKSYCE